MVTQKACGEELATTTMLTTARAGHTHSHSYPPVHPSPITDHPKDIGPLGTGTCFWPHCTLQLTDIGEAKGPHTPTATSRCGLPNPIYVVCVPECTLAKQAGLWNTT